MRVFFSYARNDGAFALQLASDLRSAAVEIWIDQLDIHPGEHWDSSIEVALKSCPAFLVILSSRSVQSRNVMDEVNYALEEGKSGMMTGIVNGCFQMVEIPDPTLGPRTVDLPSMYNTERYRPIYSGKAGYPVFLAHAK